MTMYIAEYMPYLRSILELFKPLPVCRKHGTKGALILVIAVSFPGGVLGTVGPHCDFWKGLEEGLVKIKYMYSYKVLKKYETKVNTSSILLFNHFLHVSPRS